jgi:hypothetical protein
LAISFKYSRTASLAGRSSLPCRIPWLSYLVFGRLPSDLEDLDALLTKVLLHVGEEDLDLFGAQVFRGKPLEKVAGGNEAALPTLRGDGLHGFVETGRLVPFSLSLLRGEHPGGGHLWPIRGGYRQVAGNRHGSVAQLEREARCLFEDPNTTVHGPVVSGRAPQREREPLAHAGVTAGGRHVRTKRLGSACNRRGSNACARRTLTQLLGKLTRESNLGTRPRKRSPTGHRFGPKRTFSET